MATDVYFARGGITYGEAVSGWRGPFVTWPFVTLRASREALVLRIGLFWPFVRTFTFLREDVLSLRVRRGLLTASLQVEHKCPDCPPVITFATVRPRALFAALADLGYSLTPRQKDARETTPLVVLATVFALFDLIVLFAPSSTPLLWRLLGLAWCLGGGFASYLLLLGLVLCVDVVEKSVRRWASGWGTGRLTPAASGCGSPEVEQARSRAAWALGLLAFLGFSAVVILTQDGLEAAPLGERLAAWAWQMLALLGLVVPLNVMLYSAVLLFRWARARLGR